MSRIVDVAKTLSKCGSAFRGHDEKEDLHNRGHFLETVGLLSRRDHDFADYLKQSGKNCTYLSNRAQNDMIHAMAMVVKNEVVQGICETKLYSIMMDETMDVTGKEQVCVVVRFVDASDVIQERILAFKPVAKTDAETLFSFLKESLESQKLEMRNIVGQCFDSASNMEGEHNGMQAKVKHVAPTAMYMYVHCYHIV